MFLCVENKKRKRDTLASISDTFPVLAAGQFKERERNVGTTLNKNALAATTTTTTKK